MTTKTNPFYRIATLPIYLFAFLLFCLSTIRQAGAQQLSYSASNQAGHGGITDLTGNVSISQGGSVLHCDKGIYYNSENRFEGTGRIHMIDNGTHIYAESVVFKGNENLVCFRGNINLVDGDIKLTTNFLDFNTKTSQGFFYNGGQIVDTSATLNSTTGYYYPRTKSYFFKDKVVLKNKDFTLFTDTLKYTKTDGKAYVFGPTRIVGDSTLILCTNGWYDTKNGIVQMTKRPSLKNKNQKIIGDSLFYNKKLGYGRAFRNTVIWDSTQNVFIKGNKAEYFKEAQRSMVTDRAVFIDASNAKDSMYLHADTLRSVMIEKEKYRLVKAYYHVQVYKSDFQMRCDSLIYNFKDSVVQLHRNPVLWADASQLTADYIEAFMKSGQLHHANMKDNAFIVNEESKDKYNQVSGLSMTGFFKKNKISRIDVNKNGCSLYYAKDKETMIGLNKAESSKMKIYLKENTFETILFLTKPVAKLTPLKLVDKDEAKLKGFDWKARIRPLNKAEIFVWK